jgi:hypothetical protein
MVASFGDGPKKFRARTRFSFATYIVAKPCPPIVEFFGSTTATAMAVATAGVEGVPALEQNLHARHRSQWVQ